MNKQIIHDALVLTAFTLVIGVILGAVYGITKAPIDKANEQTKKEAYQAVFADASGFNQQEYDADAADKMVADAGEARVGYHKEVKTASFQGKSITVENLTPMLSPRARDKRKREIESCLYEVFVKYAPGRAQMH